ncbi:MAG: twin-arginine translocation signal domain-containing protein [Verrucomicrobia bacterium]|nr:twin-arginine translocation signal domain-containing protein [Verrucomicrobiota bacterium]
MKAPLDRRSFLRHSTVGASALALAWQFEERQLLAQQTAPTTPDVPAPVPAPRSFPAGKIGKLSVSRLIGGGNLISGFAHSRDLIYVSPLLRQYFTDAKVHETFALGEAQGMNTVILRLDDHTLRILKSYWRERGRRLQWIAQVKLPEKDRFAEIQRAVDEGASAVFVHGGVGDGLVEAGDFDLLGRAITAIRHQGVPAGVAGHALAVPMACEREGLEPDFYMKTFNSKQYWSAGPMPRFDSVWEETPQETMQFMAEVEKPWIAYKVLGAGAIHPEQGFRYAYENGADFICAGMFDFQVEEDAAIARRALDRARNRSRPWCG